MPYPYGMKNNRGLPPQAVQSVVGLSTDFPAIGKGLGGLPQRRSFTYSLGTSGVPGFSSSGGFAGGTSQMSFLGVTLTANGGGGGIYNTNTNAAGGTATGGLFNATGGTGGGVVGDNGGGGGGGINLSNRVTYVGEAGQSGANANDFQGLSAALIGTGFFLGTGGDGSPAGSGATGNINNGFAASGIGAGGGGAGWWGGTGGAGSYGGGGGGASGYTSVLSGGAGGSGVLVIRINNKTTFVLTTGTFYEIPQGTISLKVWLIGAGGGGAGSPNIDSTSGGGGGAGGIAYYEFIL